MQAEEFAAHAALEDQHWWFTARREILRRLIGVVACPGKGIAVADVGCGTGGNAAALAADYRVLGLDPSEQALGLARARYPAVTFVQSDNPGDADMHLAKGGVLLMSDVLEHVADAGALLARAVAAVPSGGHLLLTVPADPALWSRHDTAFGHFRRYDVDTFRALWRELPVAERLLSPFNARLRPAIALVRRFTRDGGSDLRMSPGPFNTMLHRVFAGEASALCPAVDRGTAPYARGVSLVALLRKQ